MLVQAKSDPDLNKYLAYILSDTGPSDLARVQAAVQLKNNIKSIKKGGMADDDFTITMNAVLVGIRSPKKPVRNGAAIIPPQLFLLAKPQAKKHIFAGLFDIIENRVGVDSDETRRAQAAAMSAMANLCEDNRAELEKGYNGERPLNYLLPRLIEATKIPVSPVRAKALECINTFAYQSSQAMLNSIDSFLEQMDKLADDFDPNRGEDVVLHDGTMINSDIAVQILICRAFVCLVEARPDKLQPSMGQLVDFIIKRQTSGHEILGREAAEFWLAVGDHHSLWKALTPHMLSIIPVLLDCMVYSKEYQQRYGGASDDADQDDKDEDIKPHFVKTALRGGKTNGDAPTHSAADGNMGGTLEDGEISDSEDGEDDPDTEWTVRKCSAAALDVLARDFHDPVFESMLGYLDTNLSHEQWPYREAAVLALGAVAEGCMSAVTPHLPRLVPYLIGLLYDSEPLVQVIACWTLGRYSSWAADLSDEADKATYFVPLMEGILNTMLDNNKKVQEAGASAFVNLEEKARKKLGPYLVPIVQQFVRCFAKFKEKNMYVLYDCIQTLAEYLGPELARPEVVNELMPALTFRYDNLTDQSRELSSLLQCLSYLAVALGDAFWPYSAIILNRCLSIIDRTLEDRTAAAEEGNDLLVTTLDLVSAIIQALDNEKARQVIEGPAADRGTEPVTGPQARFFTLVRLCMGHPRDDVRQSAYALLGDCARYLFPLLQPFLPELIPILLEQLDLDHLPDNEVEEDSAVFNVVNNACWSAGEIAIKRGKSLAAFAPELLKRCVQIMENLGVTISVRENAAMAVGRLGLDNAELLAPYIAEFADHFLDAMDEVDPTEEKATAFTGFAILVATNPQALVGTTVIRLFEAIARYQDLGRLRNPSRQGLHDMFQNVSLPH